MGKTENKKIIKSHSNVEHWLFLCCFFGHTWNWRIVYFSQFWCISLLCFNRMVWLSWLNDCYWPRITHFPAFVFANKAKTKVINNPVQIQPKCIRERIAQNISHDWRSNNWAFDISLLVHKAMPRNHSEKTYFSFLLNYKLSRYAQHDNFKKKF